MNLLEIKNNLDRKYQTNLKLSMGMSGDYKLAVDIGTDYVRVGSSIFGKRS